MWETKGGKKKITYYTKHIKYYINRKMLYCLAVVGCLV